MHKKLLLAMAEATSDKRQGKFSYVRGEKINPVFSWEVKREIHLHPGLRENPVVSGGK